MKADALPAPDAWIAESRKFAASSRVAVAVTQECHGSEERKKTSIGCV